MKGERKMLNKGKIVAAQRDGVAYRRAKTWQIILSQLYCAAGMCFYLLMTYATYIGNSGYGVLVGVTGIIITASRVFDGVTDPICAYIIERFHSRFGKVRIFMLLGWAIMALATTAMCNWGAGHLDGVSGLIFFIVCYMLYIVGYTLQGVSTNMVGPIMSNDPGQRPTISVWGTVYGYLAPMAISMISMAVILPKYNSEIGIPFLKEYNLFVVGLSLVLYLLSAVGITPYDKQENFEGISVGSSKASNPTFRDMWDLLKNNKEMQRYLVSAVSDKLAQTIGSAAVISTMLSGILIGNMAISSILSTVAMLPSILFAIIGARLAGKQGNKKVMVRWSWVCIWLNVVFALFLLFSDTRKITVALIPSVIYIAISLGNNAAKMVVSTATGAYRMDIIDYEMYRSGKYMPATVSAAYTFLDKLISAFGSTIATLMIGLIGYTSTTPQQGDPLTMGVRVMTVLLYCGFPIIGWVCTVVAMRKSELSYEKMVEVQKSIADRKASGKGENE